jgi:hypothetical protein
VASLLPAAMPRRLRCRREEEEDGEGAARADSGASARRSSSRSGEARRSRAALRKMEVSVIRPRASAREHLLQHAGEARAREVHRSPSRFR